MSTFDPRLVNPYIIRCGYMNEVNCIAPGMSHGERCVKWFEVELILWGEGYIYTEGKKLSTKKGDIFFRKPGMLVEGIAPYHCYLLVFDMVYEPIKWNFYQEENCLCADQSLPFTNENKALIPVCSMDFSYPPVMPAKQYEKYEELFKNAYEESIRSRNESQFYLKNYLLQILSLMFTDITTSEQLSHSSRSFRSNYPKVMEAKQYIDNLPGTKLSLEKLADVAGLSPNFFCRIFKDIIGLSPVSYINRCKIAHAKRLLVETRKSVKEISYDCGFDNETYFYTLFKRLEMISPMEFRDQKRIGLW